MARSLNWNIGYGLKARRLVQTLVGSLGWLPRVEDKHDPVLGNSRKVERSCEAFFSISVWVGRGQCRLVVLLLIHRDRHFQNVKVTSRLRL